MKAIRPLRSRSGFTLIELSIVLVIIGLIVGGILVGRDMIRAAEIRNVVSEFDRIKTAVYTFKNKYNCLPGDCANGTALFGAAHANATTCQTTQGTGTQTCNGNGDGKVDTGDPGYQSYGSYDEMYRFWQQLGNASLIEGQYTGVAGPAGTYDHITGTNCLASKLPNAGWGIAWIGIVFNDSTGFDGSFGNLLFFGKTYANNLPSNAVLTAVDAYNVDAKMDDGKPATGIVTAWKQGNPWLNPNCTTTDVASTSKYATSTSGVVCNLMFTSGL